MCFAYLCYLCGACRTRTEIEDCEPLALLEERMLLSEILVLDCIRYYIFDFLRECTLMRTRFRLQRYKEFLRYTNIRKKFLKIIQRPMAYYLRQGLLFVLSGK